MNRRTVCSTVAILAIILAGNHTAVAEWETETVEQGKQFTDMTHRCMQLDSNGNPHIAYGEEMLYYAHCDGILWHYEAVDDSPGVGTHASMALDGETFPHIAYYDDTNSALKYAWKDETGWHIEMVDQEGDVGRAAIVRLDQQAKPHIAYRDLTNEDLKYAYRNETGWHIETVASEGNVGIRPSLDIDQENSPHISFRDETDDKLRYAHRGPLGWIIETVDDGGYHSSLALDDSDTPHIGFSRDYYNHYVNYAFKAESGWEVEIADSSSQTIYYKKFAYISIAVDNADRPHLGYYYKQYIGDIPPWWFSGCSYSYRDSLGWHHGGTDYAYNPYGGTHVSLDIDFQDHPHLTYIFPRGGTGYRFGLRYAFWDGSSWHREMADFRQAAGRFSSIAVAQDNEPQIGYSSGGLRFAHRSSSGWQIETVGGSAGYSSLVIDSIGYRHMSYWDDRNNDLMYAYEDNSGWHRETVDCEGSVGRFTSLALADIGDPHISYLDEDSLGLNYAYRDSEGWHINAIESDVGAYSSLVLDQNGNPHVSYYDGNTPTRLKYAFLSESGWQIETVLSYGGAYGSMVLDADGYPEISCRYHSGHLGFASKGPAGWTVETIDEVECLGTSLFLDTYDFPHIAYVVPNHVKYAYNDGFGWHIETVIEGTADPAEQVSLAIDSNGYAHISYQEVNSGDLRYAYGGGPILTLAGNVVAGDLQLTWLPVPAAAAFWVYGESNLPWFVPGMAPGYEHRVAIVDPPATTWSSPNGIGDPTSNWTYMVMAIDETEAEITRSNRVGEWDWGMDLESRNE
jgi:hypothetical protein